MTPVLELYPIEEKLGISKYIGSHEFSTNKQKMKYSNFSSGLVVLVIAW
jgi:hypothetical protein